MEKISEVLIYYAFTLFSNKEVIRAYTKSWAVSIFAFIISIFILLTPIVYHYLLSSDSKVVNKLNNIDLVFNEIYSQQINCKIDKGSLICVEDKSYEFTSNGYLVLINKDFDYSKEGIEQTPKSTDNIVVFNRNNFFARYVQRESGDSLNKPSQILSGNYSSVINFDFKEIYNNGLESSNEIKDSYYLASTIYFLSRVQRSNFIPTLILWFFQFTLSFILLLIPSSLLLNYGNKRGQRADEYKLTGSFKICMVMFIAVSFICALIGVLSFELAPILLTIFYTIRLLLIYLHQFTRRGQKYNIIKYKSI